MSKRIAFCADGTWDKALAATPMFTSCIRRLLSAQIRFRSTTTAWGRTAIH